MRQLDIISWKFQSSLLLSTSRNSYLFAIQKIMKAIFDVETRAYITLCVNQGHSPTQTYKLPQKTQTTRCCSIVSKKHERFLYGHPNLEVTEWFRRQRPILTLEKQKIEDILVVDCCVTVRGEADKANVTCKTFNPLAVTVFVQRTAYQL